MKEYIGLTVMGEGMISVEKGTTFEQIALKYRQKFKSDIMLAKLNNKLYELSDIIKDGGDLQFYDITNKDGMRVYQRSISFLMIKAVKEIIGIDAEIVIEHSLKKNLYCQIRNENIKIDGKFLDELQSRMEDIVKKDIPIVKEVFKRDDAIEIAKNYGLIDKVRLFKFRRASNVNLYNLGGAYDYFYGYMVPSTGYLKKFKILPEEKGFLIVLPSSEHPDVIQGYVHPEKISRLFLEQLDWCRLMGVKTVADLNDVIVSGKFNDLVLINEALHEKKIANIADEILKRKGKVKVVMVAGPSSSGKTTFAQRLCVQLRVNGIIPHAISLDNYFIERDKTPLDEDGKHNFENIDVLDVELFNSDIKRLIEGETVELPHYNFITGKREYNGDFIKLGKNEIFVIEGIHGLNDVLTSSINNENKFRIFVSAINQLNIDDHNRISTTDCRIIRRIVRDNKFRGHDAAATIGTWDKVVAGEEKNIFPYQENADVMFNSSTIYELAVLKTHVEPLLFSLDKNSSEFTDAKRIMKFLDYVLAADSELVPKNSIIKEFLGGSCFNV